MNKYNTPSWVHSYNYSQQNHEEWKEIEQELQDQLNKSRENKDGL